MVKKQTTSKNKNQTITEKPSSSKPIQTQQHVDFPPLTSKFYLEIKEIEADQIILIPVCMNIACLMYELVS